MTYSGLTDFDHALIKMVGMNEEYFYALPYECRKAIIMAGTEAICNEQARKDFFNKIQETKINEKDLVLLKRNK